MLVSVIIPVYNAEKYVSQAVESALMQPETGEIILIEDASPDNALQVCQELAKKHQNIKLIRHADGKNHGASASRNLGIKNAEFDCVAFLDADDFYLPGCFKVAKEKLISDPTIDGVYEAVGTYFENKEKQNEWFWKNRKIITTIREIIEPDLLFEALMSRQVGHLHLNGLVVRKKIFEQVGYFDEQLKLRQDTALFLKMAALCKLVSGNLTEPFRMRRVHNENRVSASKEKYEYYSLPLWKSLIDWGHIHKLDKRRMELLVGYYSQTLVQLLKEVVLNSKKSKIDIFFKRVVTEEPSIMKSKGLLWYTLQAIFILLKRSAKRKIFRLSTWLT